MKGILKWPLILAAVVTVLRVVVEQAGASGTVSNLFSVVALHFAIMPIYFAIRIAKGALDRPYGTQFKLTLLYVVWARVMILPTYWLAYIFQWPQVRFSPANEPGATWFVGFIAVPFITGIVWVVSSTIFGTGVGSAIIAIFRSVRGRR